MARRGGTILIALGVAILLYQTSVLLLDPVGRAKRQQVLTGSIDEMAGAHELRPAVSVIGVASLAGGIFLLALGGKRK